MKARERLMEKTPSRRLKNNVLRLSRRSQFAKVINLGSNYSIMYIWFC